MRKRLGLIAAGAALAIASGTAAARSDISFGILIGAPIVAPAPVYVAPPPVVYVPAAPRVYYQPAPRVYYAPAYYGPAPVVIKYKHGHRHYRHW